jgi:hypothetical protein
VATWLMDGIRADGHAVPMGARPTPQAPDVSSGDAQERRSVLDAGHAALAAGPDGDPAQLDAAMTACAGRLLTLRARLVRLGDATAHLAERGFADRDVAAEATDLAGRRRDVLAEYTELRALIGALRALRN